MEEKLEKLAKSRRRLTTDYPDNEFTKEDILYSEMAVHEAEDRKSGRFPYDKHVQTITDFYKGKDIFITGGTGFVGKVLIEKILRSVPKGGRIFLLIRSRKQGTPQQRVDAMLKLPLFELVMSQNPDAAKRLVAVEGDCRSLGLGLSLADRQTIIDNVSIVFHCAATVQFTLPLSYVVLANTRGTREVAYLCKELKKLDVFVHVSTAYTCATSNRTTPIPEAVLPADVDWRIVIAAAEQSIRKSKNDGFDLIFQKLQPYHPNNYTFCKLLAENIVEEECKDLPAIIVRPPVLLASYEDPFGGWLDNMYGPFSIWDGIGRGIIRTNYGDRHKALDFMPVDHNVKALISAAWHRGLNFRIRSDPEKVDVINNSISNYYRESFGVQYERMKKVQKFATHKNVLRHPRLYITKSFWIFWLITVTSHLPLGYFVDTALKLSGKKPMLLRVYRQIYIAQTRLLYAFCSQEFNFDCNAQWMIEARMPKEDRGRFSWIGKQFSFAYAVDIFNGIIRYVFKATPVQRHQSNLPIMLIIDWIHTAILVGLGLWILLYLNSVKVVVYLLFICGFVVLDIWSNKQHIK